MQTPPSRPLAARAKTLFGAGSLGLALLAAALFAPFGVAEPPGPLDPKVKVELARSARAYLQIEADPFNGRQAVLAIIAKQAAAGRDMLGNMADLREIAYQGRVFDPPYTDRKWQKAEPATEVVESKWAVNVQRGDRLRLSYSVPKKEHIEANLTKVPRIDPFPALVTLIEGKDYEKGKFPGEEVIARRYASTPALQAAYKELSSRWIVFAPVAVRGNYVENGMVRSLFFLEQLRDFNQRHHVDFDRVVLDGDATSATAVAAAHPWLFSGLVVRRPLAGAPTIDEALTRNYANVPIYVVDCKPTYDALQAAGHPEVTLGDDAGVLAWMTARRRAPPRSFSWRCKTAQHDVAHWALVHPNWSAADRTLKVEVLDTAEDPNTIRIEAQGIFDLTLLLNDDIVALTREVRVVCNGKQLLKAKLERSLERVFDLDPVWVRREMNYGMLFSALSPKLVVPVAAVAPPTPGAAPPGTAQPAGASDRDEQGAADLLAKAEEMHAGGNSDAAMKYLEKVLKDFPTTKAAVTAKELLAKLKEGAAGATDK